MWEGHTEIKRIWGCLGDEESKRIFCYRCMYFLTEDNSFLRKTALTVPEAEKVYNRLKNSRKRKLIFGAGIWGEGILKTFNDIEFEGFVDNYRDEKELYEFSGKKVLSFQEYLAQYKDDLIVISSRVYNKQIYWQLVDKGISKENIVNIGEINDFLNKKQYFDLPQLKENMQNSESFVDGGSLDGRSAVCFKEWCDGRYSKIYAVEPDTKNIGLCRKMFQRNDITNYEIITKGLWDKEAVLEFEESGNGVSKLVNGGAILIFRWIV